MSAQRSRKSHIFYSGEVSSSESESARESFVSADIFLSFKLPFHCLTTSPLFPLRNAPLSRLVLSPEHSEGASKSFSFPQRQVPPQKAKMQSALAASRGSSIAAAPSSAAGRRSAANVGAPAARPCVRVASASAEAATGTEIEFT